MKKNLPMGEDRDALRDAADRALTKGQPKRQPKPTPTVRIVDDDDEWGSEGSISERRTALSSRYGAMTADEKKLADDRRIMAERAAYDAKKLNPFRRTDDDVPAVSSGDTWNSPFIKLGGVTLTKKQFMAAVNNKDFTRLIDEAGEASTVRGKFLRSVFLPELVDAMVRNDFTYAKD